MTHYRFSFDVVKQIVIQAGFSGKWCRQLNGGWKFAVDENAGLLWSPTRQKLSFYGSNKEKKRLQESIEGVLKSNLIASAQSSNTEERALERIDNPAALLAWLIQFMATGPKLDYPEALVEYAEMLVEEWSYYEDVDRIEDFGMWSPAPTLGTRFSEMTRTGSTRPYSSMLMDWAGKLHDNLILDYITTDEAIEMAIESAGLEDHIREVTKGEKTLFKSRAAFEQRFGLKVRLTF